MCKNYLAKFEVNFEELKDLFLRNPERELHVTAPDKSIVKLNFDPSRVKQVLDYTPLNFGGDPSLPVVVEKKTKHLVSWDDDLKKWYLHCGKVHFPWCRNHRGRKS